MATEAITALRPKWFAKILLCLQEVEDQHLHTDEYLFARIAEGDEGAFAHLFNRYLPKLELVIGKIVDESSAANDIMQDIFYIIWLKRDQLPEIKSPASWIYRIMYNRSLTWVERTKARERKQREQPATGPVNDTEETIRFRETTRLVQEAILQMPEQTQKIYRLSRESGLRIPEIAEMLNLSPHTVKNTIVRGGKLIREHLKNNGIIVPLLLFTFH